MLDIGGESTRPGAARVPAREQVARVVPIIEAIRACDDPDVAGIPISIDTTLSEVAQVAIDAGADAINDVSGASEDPALLEVAARTGAGLVLMHRGPAPPQDQYADEYEHEPRYEGGVVSAVRANLEAQARRARAAGIASGALVIDPGLGFGKSVAQNMALVRATVDLMAMGLPVYLGASRKRFVGRVSLGRSSEPSERLAGSIALTVLGALGGASLHRVHDVAEHVRALSVVASWNAAAASGVGTGTQPSGASSGSPRQDR